MKTLKGFMWRKRTMDGEFGLRMLPEKNVGVHQGMKRTGRQR